MFVDTVYAQCGRRALVPGLPRGVGLTALCTAGEREAESRRPDRFFEDPLARVLTEVIGVTPRMRGPWDGRSVRDPSAVRDFVALRTRFFDDALRAAPACCRQVVLLGSGLDSRAFRLDWARGTVVYELDRSDVLRLKHDMVARAGREPRCARVEVAADLRGDWPGALRAAGFNPWRPTVWVVEELLPYLSRAENDRVLTGITAMSAPGSRLTADHFDRALRCSAGFSAMTEVRCAVGAVWRSTLEGPDRWLAPHGWTCGLTDPGELALRNGRRPPGLFTPHSGSDGHLWLMNAVR
jgi:methyltransferase (TIGR00027 family)